MHANSVLCIFTIKGKGRISRRNWDNELVAEPLAKTVAPASSVARVPFMRAGGSAQTDESGGKRISVWKSRTMAKG
jgi:hypothetical protein